MQLAEQAFTSVVGVDRSAAQLQEAKPHPDVQYRRIEDASNLSDFGNSQFDCVTIGQGLHWLPFATALSEFKRVLKPGGVFAALGYGVCRIVDEPQGMTESCITN